ncbi:unnamed protein product, partial [Symbiodinium sp. CCMP2456]
MEEHLDQLMDEDRSTTGLWSLRVLMILTPCPAAVTRQFRVLVAFADQHAALVTVALSSLHACFRLLRCRFGLDLWPWAFLFVLPAFLTLTSGPVMARHSPSDSRSPSGPPAPSGPVVTNNPGPSVREILDVLEAANRDDFETGLGQLNASTLGQLQHSVSGVLVDFLAAR